MHVCIRGRRKFLPWSWSVCFCILLICLASVQNRGKLYLEVVLLEGGGGGGQITCLREWFIWRDLRLRRNYAYVANMFFYDNEMSIMSLASSYFSF